MYSQIVFKLAVVFVVFNIDSFSNGQDEKLDFDLYPNYGTDWLYFPDGNGNLQVGFLGAVPETNDVDNSVDEDVLTTVALRGSINNDVFFTLYTKHDPKMGQQVHPTTDSITSSEFDPSRPSKFIVHGWLSNGNTTTCQGIKNEYLKTHDYNVFVVDWSAIAGNMYYPIPMAATREVAEYYAKFVDMLIDAGSSADDIHLVGHSLGAHISGFTGDMISRGKIGRVTGLDPALPGFQIGIFTGGRLSTSSAKFVDVIHTCGGALGFLDPIGHADFFPNGGSFSQPGCGDMKGMMEGCSHGRSWEYFMYSINVETSFLAYRCATFNDYLLENCQDDPVTMGEKVSHSARGNYFLRTNPQSPFARNDALKKAKMILL